MNRETRKRKENSVITAKPHANLIVRLDLLPSVAQFSPIQIDVMADENNLKGADHRGEPLAPDVDLFAPGPAEVGAIRSAESTLKVGQNEKPLLLRLVLAWLCGGATVVAVLLIPHDRASQTVVYVIAAAVGLIVASLAWYFTRFAHRCTYVGEDGIARSDLRGRRDAQPKSWTLLFADAAALRASQTRQFVNGVYTGTRYNYRWVDAQGLRRAQLKGTYHGKDKPPKAGDAYHFAAAAEVAWSVHLLARIDQQLQAEGSIPFRVDSNRVVRVGPGFLEFHFGGEPTRVTREEIANVTLGGGTFSFKHKDATWYSRAGKYSFQYGTMDNGKLFLLAMEKLMGYRWG
jgi:hypothetical protein